MVQRKRLCIVSGGLGGLATSATIRVLEQGNFNAALLYPPFESNQVENVLAQYPERLRDCVRTYECDITSPESVRSAFQALIQDYPHSTNVDNQSLGNEQDDDQQDTAADVLLNAAGVVKLSPLESTPFHSWQSQLSVNLTGPYLCSNEFAKWNIQDKRPARIISIASQAAHVALPEHGPYCASKAGLLGLIKCQAAEWGPHGITSNAISPTVVLTPLGKEAWSGSKAEEFMKKIPTGKFVQPEEVANTVVFLASKEALSINGTDIRIDGGFTIT